MFKWLTNLLVVGWVQATKFVTTGGTATQFVKGDGSLDTTVYSTQTNIDSSIGGIEIGGRNLLLDSNKIFVDRLNEPLQSRKEYVQLSLEYSEVLKNEIKEEGDRVDVIISFDFEMVIRTPNPSLNVYHTGVVGEIRVERSVLLDFKKFFGDNIQVGDTLKGRVYVTNGLIYEPNPTSSINRISLYSQYLSDNFYKVSNIKIEKGNKATDWTPAPEDQVTDWNETNVDSFAYLKNKPTKLTDFTNDIPAIDISGKADKTTTISAGTGLTGGGSLAANRTLTLSAGTISDIAKGVTANGWGDHSQEGYALDSGVIHTNSTAETKLGKLTIDNDFAVTGTSNQHGIYDDSNNIRRITTPTGATFRGTGTITGAIKIKLPVSYNSSMISFKVIIRNHTAPNRFSVLYISGFNESSTLKWLSTKVLNITDDDFDPVIRFGDDGDTVCVWIGDVDSVWMYSQFYVTEFQASHSGALNAEWLNPWSISIATTLDNVKTTLNNNYLYADWNKLKYKPTTFPASPHIHAASDIASGIIDYARLPISSGNVTNWNTAFGWDNHATKGYLKAADISNKVDKITGKGLSENDYTTAEKNKVVANTLKVSNATHTGDVTGATALTIATSAVTLPKMQNIATKTFLGRATANTGNVEALTVAQMQTLLGFSTQTLSNSTSNLIVSNTVQRAALTGDVTATQNSNTTTIANSAVTHAKYQNIETQRILGRSETGIGNVQELTLGSNLTLSTTGVLSATNTNTTYSAGTGLTLSGTAFSLPVTVSGTGTYVQSVTQTTNGITVTLGTPPNTNTTYSSMAIAELNAGTVTSARTIAASVLNQWLNAKGFSTQTLTAGSNITISGNTISATNTTYTANDILTSLKTVDGSGSGLDADLLRGYHWGNIGTDLSVNGLRVGRGLSFRFTNTALGVDALDSNSSGSHNLAIGYETLKYSTGWNNTAAGFKSLTSTTSGEGNTALGQQTLSSNTVGQGNVAIGQTCLLNHTDGMFNVAVGNSALLSITSGDNNTALGMSSLLNLISGHNNTALGANSGLFHSTSLLTSISNSVLLGHDSKPLANGETNTIVIGHGAIGAGSNTVTIGNDSIVKTFLKGDTDVGGKVTATSLKIGNWEIIPNGTSLEFRLSGVAKGRLTSAGVVEASNHKNGLT